MIGEWTTNETTAPQVNKIFDHFREKLFEIINPPPPPVNKETWPLRLGIGKVLKSYRQSGLHGRQSHLGINEPTSSRTLRYRVRSQDPF